jgi:Cu+-exporting ATPase
MTCGNCARRVTEAIQNVAGVHSARVSLDSGRASVRWAGVEPDASALVRAVAAKGYRAKVLAAASEGRGDGENKTGGWRLNLWIGVLGTVPIMIGEWIFNLGMVPWFQWCSFALAGAVQISAGAPFYRGAWSQLRLGRSNMDTLVALGSTTAFAYSAWALFSGHGGHVYFMEAAAIITLISIGHWMESRVSARASSALRRLLNLAPQTARRLECGSPVGHEPGGATPTLQHSNTPDLSAESKVPVAELCVGDLVALRPGDRVPTDGEVVDGGSAVDEAMLTGESVPVDKSVKSRLYAGTVNLNGRLVMRVTATGEETALAHIIAAVQRAQSSRANIQRIGDRVSNVFVPAVVLVAVAAGLWWGLAPETAQRASAALAPFLWPAHPPAGAAAAFIIAAAVLIIACPCAMGLATPAAIMAGSNVAARRGILIRDGVALEKAGEVTAVVFDKTGTLTAGRPVLAQVWENAGAATPDAALKFEISNPKSTALAAALARHSTHPISQAIASADSGQVELAAWQEVRGAGVEANIQQTSNIEHRTSNIERRTEDSGKPGTWHSAPDTSRTNIQHLMGQARLGSLKWLRESGVDLAAGERFVAEWSAQGATIVGLAAGKSLLALFAVKDTLKPRAAEVIGYLRRHGLEVHLVTGDNTLTAAGIASQAGIAPGNVHSEVRPEQKAEFVKRLQQQGERVAFVGDGINDAPALEQADLGIAVSRASDVAREAADVILLNSEIEAVPESLGLARATLRTIKQNLFWAFFYNAIGVPLAALGFLSPILCAAAMGLSDLIVIGNALRLRNWRLPRR